MEDHFPLWSRKKYGYDFLRGAIRLSILQVVQSLAARRLPPLGTSLEKWPRDGSSPPRCEKGEGTRGPDPFTFTLLSRRSSTIFFVLSVFFSRKKNIGFCGFWRIVCVFFFGFLTHFISGRLAYKNSLFTHGFFKWSSSWRSRNWNPKKLPTVSLLSSWKLPKIPATVTTVGIFFLGFLVGFVRINGDRINGLFHRKTYEWIVYWDEITNWS